MIPRIASSLSGLIAQERKVATTAHNVANVDTDGFKKSRLLLEEGPRGGVSTRSETVNSPGPLAVEQTAAGERLVEQSNVDLAEEMPSLVLARRAYQANVKVVQTEDEMLGALLDIKG